MGYITGSHLTREPTASPVLIRWWNWEQTLATNFGNHPQMVTKVGGHILAIKFGFVPDCKWMLSTLKQNIWYLIQNKQKISAWWRHVACLILVITGLGNAVCLTTSRDFNSFWLSFQPIRNKIYICISYIIFIQANAFGNLSAKWHLFHSGHKVLMQPSWDSKHILLGGWDDIELHDYTRQIWEIW